MTYELAFSEKAWKEWRKLNGLGNAYKIKLHSSGYRLVYRVIDDVLVVTVIAVGKRERAAIYKEAGER